MVNSYRKGVSDLNGDDLTALQMHIETKQWGKAWTEYLSLRKSDGDSVHLSLIGSHAAFGLGLLFDAKRLAEFALANVENDYLLLGKIHFHLGMVYQKSEETSDAIAQFQTFLSEVDTKYPSLEMGIGKAHFYLGLAYRVRKEWALAIDSYQSAINWSRDENIKSLLCASLQNLAWLCLLMDELDASNKCLVESSSLCQSSEDLIQQRLSEAFLALKTSQFTKALSLCQGIMLQVERGESVSLGEQAQAIWLSSEVAFHLGNFPDAERLASVAVSVATGVGNARVINDANSVLTRVRNVGSIGK